MIIGPADTVARLPEFPAWLAAHGGWYEDTREVEITDDARSVVVTQLRYDPKGKLFIEGNEIAHKVNVIPLQRPVPQWLRDYLPVHLQQAVA